MPAGLHHVQRREEVRSRGVFRPRFFPRYFRVAGSRTQVPDRVIDQWFRQVGHFPEGADRFLRALVPTPFALNLMLGVRDALPTLAPDAQRGVLLALARSVPAFTQGLDSPGLRNPVQALMATLLEFIEQCSAEDAVKLVMEIITLLPDEAALHLMTALERTSQSGRPSPWSAGQRAELVSHLGDTLASRFEGRGGALRASLKRSYGRGLHLMARHRGRTSSQNNLVILFGTGQAAVVDVLATLSVISERLYLPNHFDRRRYMDLKDIIDPDVLIQWYEPIFPASETPAPEVGRRFFSDGGHTTERHEAARRVASRIRRFRTEETA